MNDKMEESKKVNHIYKESRLSLEFENEDGKDFVYFWKNGRVAQVWENMEEFRKDFNFLAAACNQHFLNITETPDGPFTAEQELSR